MKSSLRSIFVWAAGLAFSEFLYAGSAVYTSNGTWTVPSGVTTVNVLVVAAGGGGGGNSGFGGAGGGGGGVVYAANYSVTSGANIPVYVGAGGAGAGRGDGGSGANGGNSSFGSLVAYGGGGGAYGNNGGGNGGSGGGAAQSFGSYGLGTSGQGNNGGQGANWGTGGGGGPGAVGGNANPDILKGGDGGGGYYSTITGTGQYFAGGGGGWGYYNSGAGGSGGGGTSGTNGTPATAGTANSGGGGGGGGTNGAGKDGGSGIVVLSWTDPAPTVTSSLSVSANQGQGVSYTITATASPTSFGATNLPAGLSINTSTGVISGSIPTNGGAQGSDSTTYSTISATNAVGTGSATLTWHITAASITTNASVSPTSTAVGLAVTLTRAGSANFGIAWTENTIWRPDGTPQGLGNLQLGSQGYTPATQGTYWYQFRIVDGYYNYKEQWISFTASGLSPPSGLQATGVLSYSVALGWNAVNGAVGYNVYRNGVKLNSSPISGTSFTDTTAQPGTGYTYAVTAVASDNSESVAATLNLTTAGSFEVFAPLP
jgi:Glycine-rich domain/Putative Ig domain/Rhamnogalacturonan I lyases beta-sheet domain